MPLAFDGDRARFQEICTIEEVEALLAWLETHPGGVADLTGCEVLHAALLQVLLASRVAVEGRPNSAFLQRYVLPLFGPTPSASHP